MGKVRAEKSVLTATHNHENEDKLEIARQVVTCKYVQGTAEVISQRQLELFARLHG